MAPKSRRTSPYAAYAPHSERRRPARVADLIRSEVSMLLLRQINDPRIREKTVSITGVEVSPDLKSARLYFSVLGSEEDVEAVEEGLSRAKGFIRSHLGRVLDLKFVPEISFWYDKSMIWQEKMERLLKEIREEE